VYERREQSRNARVTTTSTVTPVTPCDCSEAGATFPARRRSGLRRRTSPRGLASTGPANP